jgi:hypothetical protein
MDSIRLDDLDPISINMGGDDDLPSSSSTFGPGIEFLMNDKVKSGSLASKYGNKPASMGDLERMDEEFSRNEADAATGGGESKPLSGFGEGFFNWSNNNMGNTGDANKSVQFDTDPSLGEATANTSTGTSRTYDGFSKINEVPLEYNGSGIPTASSSMGAKMNDRERRRCKRMMLKKLEEWYEKGVIKDMHHFTLDSTFEEIEDEYEASLEDKRKKDSVKLQGWWFMTFVNSVEYANASFNPFDLNLDGWGEQVSEDLTSYDDIFGELYHKYKGAKMSPELSILLRLGFSAAMVNFTNKALSSATPGFNDVIKQSPELMKMFTNATVQSMSQNSPGFAFANNLMGNNDPKPNTSFGPPPAPVQTKPQTPMRPSMQFTQPQSQSQQQQPMFREQGVDMRNTNEYSPAMQPAVQQQQRSSASMRPEMRGPQNPEIHQLLAGLKTTHVVQQSQSQSQSQQQQQQQPVESMEDSMLPPMPQNVQQHVQANMSMPPPRAFDENDSMISVTSLQDLQNTNLPKRTRRKKTSERNTISLDI